jgi:hypothetical protein
MLTHRFQWPVSVSSLFGAVDAVSSMGMTSNVLGGFKCLLIVPGIPLPVLNMIFVAATYGIGVVITLIFWSMHYLYSQYVKKKTTNVTKNITISLVVLSFLMYSSFVRSFFQMFSCAYFIGDGHSRLYGALDTICYSSEHIFWLALVALPTFLILIVGLPLHAWRKLYSVSRNPEITPQNAHVLATYGFISDG